MTTNQLHPGHFTTVWISWTDSNAPSEMSQNKVGFKHFLAENGYCTPNAPIILSLKYGLYEVIVKEDQADNLHKLFSQNIYSPFDTESALLCVCGYKESLRIVLDAYKGQGELWLGLETLRDNRIKELKEKQIRLTA